jgi:hypothetical protein
MKERPAKQVSLERALRDLMLAVSRLEQASGGTPWPCSASGMCAGLLP